MDNATPKLDEDGIDPAFAKAISDAAAEVSERTVFGQDSGGGAFFTARRHKNSLDEHVTPIDRAHQTLSAARGLCVRLDAFIDAMIGPSSTGDGAETPRNSGAMGELEHDATTTERNIASTMKRLEELEHVVLGHRGLKTQAKR